MILPRVLSASLLAVSLLPASVFADVVVGTDAVGCPSIADHQKFMDEMNQQNWRYEYPSRCVELPRGGRRLPGPFETRSERWGDSTTNFVLIDVPGQGRYWTLESWVDVVDDQAPTGPVVAFMNDSTVWYAKVLRERFGNHLPFHGMDRQAGSIPCLPQDITRFTAGAWKTEGDVLSVVGTVELGSVSAPFEVIDGAQGPRYMLLLQAYLFSPTGALVWSQQGYPKGDSWVESSGDSRSFTLVGPYSGDLEGFELLVLAAGDPILSNTSESRVILGAKRQVMQ